MHILRSSSRRPRPGSMPSRMSLNSSSLYHRNCIGGSTKTVPCIPMPRYLLKETSSPNSLMKMVVLSSPSECAVLILFLGFGRHKMSHRSCSCANPACMQRGGLRFSLESAYKSVWPFPMRVHREALYRLRDAGFR